MLNAFMCPCLNVLLASLLLIVGSGSVGTEPLPGRPARHVENGFRNTDSASGDYPAGGDMAIQL